MKKFKKILFTSIAFISLSLTPFVLISCSSITPTTSNPAPTPPVIKPEPLKPLVPANATQEQMYKAMMAREEQLGYYFHEGINQILNNVKFYMQVEGRGGRRNFSKPFNLSQFIFKENENFLNRFNNDNNNWESFAANVERWDTNYFKNNNLTIGDFDWNNTLIFLTYYVDLVRANINPKSPYTDSKGEYYKCSNYCVRISSIKDPNKTLFYMDVKGDQFNLSKDYPISLNDRDVNDCDGWFYPVKNLIPRENNSLTLKIYSKLKR